MSVDPLNPITFSRLEANAAFRVSMKNRGASQPKVFSNDERGSKFASPLIKTSFTITPHESIFTIGSCFARGVENVLIRNGYTVPTDTLRLPLKELPASRPWPRQVLNKYTPHSMLNEVTASFEDYDVETSMVEVKPGKYLDLQLHSDIPVSLDRAIERRNEINELNRSAIENSRVVIATLGLIEAWFDAKSGMYTNGTPPYSVVKSQPERFSFEVLSPDETISTTRRFLRKMKDFGPPDQKIILTVSPVPIGRTFTDQDVLVANSYSKSVLRVAAEVTVREGLADYFPSYETVLLSEHSASWQDDRIHVTDAMVVHNAERMLRAYAVTEQAVTSPGTCSLR